MLEHKIIENKIHVFSPRTALRHGDLTKVKQTFAKIVEEANSLETFVLNFSYVDEIDSSGFGWIFKIFKILSNSQRKLVLCSLKSNTQRVATTLMLDQLVAIYQSEEEALTALKVA